ncbi:encapsulin [Leptospira santarosai]|uniref:encapsulin n=1 Tax=Leptospira santarosai TaxID=28183 RepID=UPI0026E1BF6A|nr:encapsulin [Leptospira santarosai]MDO6395459.1 encapsulin [Leptospira santarosai]
MPILNKTVGQDSFLSKNDQLYIQGVLLRPAEEELKLRKIARVNPSFPSYAREIGYDVYQRQGRANVTAAGARPKDVHFVDESIERITQPAVDIQTAIRYGKDELQAMRAKRALGKGPAFALDQTRIDSARRFVAEREDYIGFNGEKSLKVPGILTSAGYKEQVPSFATLTTAKAMLEELHRGKTFVEKSGHFKGRTLCLTPEDQLRLLRPLNDYATVTLLEWFKQNGLFFDNIITTNALKAENNVMGQDLFMILDNNPTTLELAVLQDIVLGPPVTDVLGETIMLVDERFAGALVYYPEGIYVGMQEIVPPSLRASGLEPEPGPMFPPTALERSLQYLGMLPGDELEPETAKSKKTSEAKGKNTKPDTSQSGTDSQ